MAMASSAKFISFLFLISLLALQIHGRESQYFTKYTSNSDNEQKVPVDEVTPTTTVDPVSTNEQQYQPEQQEQQQPEFLPENQNSGYGLYGHETGSGELPSTTTPTNLPYNSESDEYNNYPDTQNNNYPNSQNSNNYYYNRDSFNGGNQDVFGTSKLSQTGYGNQKTQFNGGNNNYYSQPQRQGMSDTRFLENGKYFYDVNSENYNSNSNKYENAKNEVPSYWNNNGGYYYGQNNQNSYEYRNSMGGYQNNQGEFQNEENEFEEP